MIYLFCSFECHVLTVLIPKVEETATLFISQKYANMLVYAIKV